MEPKYASIKQILIERIRSGELEAGSKLPDVAAFSEAFGVSPITVKRALTDLQSEGYIIRIRGRGSYVRERPQAGEAPGASRLIAIVLSAEDYMDASYMRIIRGAQACLAERDYALIVEWGDGSVQAEQEILGRVLARGVDGILMYPFDPVKSAENMGVIDRAGTPYVVIDRYDPGHPAYFVGSDNYAGGMAAANELMSRGHRRIAFAAYHFFLSSERERYAGYRTALEMAGVEVREGDLLQGVDADAMAKRVRSGEWTAVFCCNDKLASRLILELTERGVRIPADLSVMGFDDWENRVPLPVGLSTIRQDFEEIGRQAAGLILQVIEGKHRDGRTKVLTGVFPMMRESVREVRG